jgi:hypothetical protein
MSILYLTYYLSNKNFEEFSDYNEKINNNQSIDNNNQSFELINNLVKNGNFENGKDIKNQISKSGYNKIISKKNPGKTSYVLEQKKTDNLTYYKITCDNDKNSKYVLYFWLAVDVKNIDEVDFNKLINIKMQNEDFSNDIPRLNYNIVQKVILSNNENDNNNIWYLLKYDFISGSNTGDTFKLFLNYSDNLQFDTYYFTDISVYKVLIDAENFIFNNKLISYVDGYHYESNIPTWHDLSGNGNDLFWSNIPLANYTIGSLNTLNMKLVGFSSNKLSNDAFTIIFCLNKNIENSASDISVNEKNNQMDFYLLSIPGNDRYSIEIKIKDNYLYLINDKNEYISKNELILYNKSLLSITYHNNIIHIYQDGLNILSKEVKKLYFNNSNIVINKNKNVDYNFYSLLFYNREVDKKEINEIRTYFITNKNKNFNSPDINIHHMNETSNYSVTKTDDNFLFKPFNKKDNKYENVENDKFIDKFENNYKEKCLTDCAKLCDKLNEKGDCMSNCKNVLLSCKDYCDKDSNKDSVYCSNNESYTNNCSNNINNNCPKVYKKDGKYMVYVAPNSEYSKMYNYSGEKSYGINQERARQTYNINFPNCPIPPELIPGEGKVFEGYCPYIINELNPCHISQCAGVNWNVDYYKNLNLNKNCKKAVSNYCQINYGIDDNCNCWDPVNKNDPHCIEFRKYFEDPNDYCLPSQFNIEDHPDFNKYIKKDSIPCWGCSL